MKAWGRLMAWLRREAYVNEVVRAATASAYQAGYQSGFVIGQAQGQLEGRKAQADQMLVYYGIEGGGKVLDEDEAQRIRTSILH